MLELAAFFFFSPFGEPYADLSGLDRPLEMQVVMTDEQIRKMPKKKPEKLYPMLTDSDRAAYLVEDSQTGTELYSANPDRVQPIASITKLMTALIILEEHKMDEVVKVSQTAANTDGAKIELKPEEEIRLQDLIAAIIIPSANDAAVALAEHNSLTEDKFVQKMNEKAAEWGFTTAEFYTATGLDYTNEKGEEKYNAMSPRDVIKLARKAWDNPFIQEYAQLGFYEATSIDGRFIHQKPTTNQLLGNFQGIKGLKTGFTESAGQCVVTIANKDGNEVFLVVLGSSDRFRVTKQILGWTWGAYVW